jgi:hypothetical protein
LTSIISSQFGQQAPRTSTILSGRDYGEGQERFRERLRISSGCLTRTGSATTAQAPPGPASRATVASKMEEQDGQVAHDPS